MAQGPDAYAIQPDQGPYRPEDDYEDYFMPLEDVQREMTQHGSPQRWLPKYLQLLIEASDRFTDFDKTEFDRFTVFFLKILAFDRLIVLEQIYSFW